MNNFEFIDILFAGFALWVLPFIYPLFFIFNIQRKVLFYFVGLLCSFACFKLAPVVMAIFAMLSGCLMAFVRHEDFGKATEYSFRFLFLGMSSGSSSLIMLVLPNILIGSLLSLIMLGILKVSLFRRRA